MATMRVAQVPAPGAGPKHMGGIDDLRTMFENDYRFVAQF